MERQGAYAERVWLCEKSRCLHRKWYTDEARLGFGTEKQTVGWVGGWY